MMNLFWKFTDYFMDFQKVRKFQEFCGLEKSERSNNANQQNGELSIDTKNKSEENYRNEIKCNKESSSDDDFIEYEPNSKQSNGSCYNELKNNSVNNASTNQLAQTYRVTNWTLYYLFRLGCTLGDEIFYISFIPFVFWNVDPFIARKMVVVWVVTMYIGQALKEFIKWPRPSWPPAFKLETRVEAEYGLPSTHAVAGTALPFSFLMAISGRYVFPFELGVLIACSWCMLVALSRLYVGMHSILDVMAGVGIAAAYLWLGWPFMDMVEEYTMTSTYAPAIVILSHYLLAFFYPSNKRYCTSRGDTVVILGSGAGINVATWMCYQYGFDYGPVGDPPYAVGLPSLTTFAIGVARTFIGLLVLLLVRAIAKSASLALSCWVAGAKRKDRLARQRKDIEINYKFITYTAVGFSTTYLVPALLKAINVTC